jgi:hypothetical protein
VQCRAARLLSKMYGLPSHVIRSLFPLTRFLDIYGQVKIGGEAS